MGFVSESVDLLRSPSRALNALAKKRVSWARVFAEFNAALLLSIVLLLFSNNGVSIGSEPFFGLLKTLGSIAVINLALPLFAGVCFLYARFLKGKPDFKKQVFLSARVFGLFVVVLAVLSFVYKHLFSSTLAELNAGWLFFVVLFAAVAWLCYLVFKAFDVFCPLRSFKAFAAFTALSIFTILSVCCVLISTVFLVSAVNEFEFTASSLSVLVVGSASPQLEYLLKAEDMRVNGIIYAGSIRPDAVVPGVLDNFDVVIISGERECDLEARDAFRDYLEQGGFMVLVGDACTEYAGESGWSVGDNSWGELLPVTFVGNEHANGKFKIYDPAQPVFNGIMDYAFSGAITRVSLKETAKLLAFIDASDSETYSPDFLTAMAWNGWSAGNNEKTEFRVYYFAFDLGTTSRFLLKNLIWESRN
ncbi:MAG: Yip1 family protein [Candidatus Micrarchaeia archaeon]